MSVISLLGFLGILTFGFFVSDSFLNNTSCLVEKVLAGFLIGSGFFTILIFIINWWFGIPFGTNYLLLFIILLNIVALILNLLVKRNKKGNSSFGYSLCFKEIFKNLSLAEKLVIAIIMFLFVSSFLQNIYWPVKDWDALAVYDFRAKTFVDTGFMMSAISSGYFTNYPLYTSLLHTVLYLFNFSNPLFVYTILYICLVSTLFFVAFRISKNRLFSLILALFVSASHSIFGHSMMAYTNLPYAVFLAVGFVYIINSFKEKDINLRIFLYGAIFVSLSSWIRISEPFWLIGLFFVLLFLLYSRKIIYTVLVSLSLYLPRFLWFRFLTENGITTQNSDSRSLLIVNTIASNIFSLDHVKIISYFYQNMLSPQIVYLLAFIISLALLIYYVFVKKLFTFDLRDNRCVFIFLPSLLVVLGILIMLFGLYGFMTSYGSYTSEIVASAERSTMPIILFILFSIFTNLYYLVKITMHDKKF